MHHLIPIAFILVILLAGLSKWKSIVTSYILLSPIPLLAFVVAFFTRDAQQINHRVLHIAYDSSYILVVLGLFCILYAVLVRRRLVRLILATLLASLPIVSIMAHS